MAFNQTQPRRTTRTPSYEGGEAYSLQPFAELYLLVATSLYLGDDAYYERGSERVERFRSLSREVIRRDWRAYAALASYARQVLNLRSTPSAMLGELFLNGRHHLEVPWPRVWPRGDEHLETMAYVDLYKDRAYPSAFKHALAQRLLSMTPRQFIKYAARSRTKSQHDALNVARPKPRHAGQAALFRWVVGGYGALSAEQLALLPELVRQREARDATWESRLSAEGSSAQTWAASIPRMGYMALLRNLRNFVEKGVDEELLRRVAATLADPDEVRRSRQFPYRFLSAYNALPAEAPSYLKEAVSQALNGSIANVPTLPGRSLVLIDVSLSMVHAPVAGNSEMLRSDVAAVLGAIFALANDADVWLFASDHEQLRVIPGSPVLAVVDAIRRSPVWGGNTYTGAALRTALSGRGFDRVVILTDGQAHDSPASVIRDYRQAHPELRTYEINLAAYPQVSLAPGGRDVLVGGFSDGVFAFMDAAERIDARQHVLDWLMQAA